MFYLGLFSALASISFLLIINTIAKKKNHKESYLAVLFSVLMTLFSVYLVDGFISNFFWGASGENGERYPDGEIYHDSVARLLCDGYFSSCIFSSVSNGHKLDVFLESEPSQEKKEQLNQRISDLKRIFNDLNCEAGSRFIVKFK